YGDPPWLARSRTTEKAGERGPDRNCPKMGGDPAKSAARRDLGAQLCLWEAVCARGVRRRSKSRQPGRSARLHIAVSADSGAFRCPIYGDDAHGTGGQIPLLLPRAGWLKSAHVEHSEGLRLGHVHHFEDNDR